MKGFTTDKQLGKRDGRRYYQQKGVEGIVSASINQGMSSRVKNDAAYANTRLNNAEFGAAGSTAGAITRSLSQKWRYLLVPFAAGKLAKDVRALMMNDTTNPWGERHLKGDDWQKVLADKVSQYSKNPVSDYEGLTYEVSCCSNNGITVNVEPTSIHNAIAEAKGATGVRIIILAGAVNASSYDAVNKGYVSASEDLKVLDQRDVNFGSDDSIEVSNGEHKEDQQTDDLLLCGQIVLLPFKTIGTEKYILQELCSFVTIAAKPE